MTISISILEGFALKLENSVKSFLVLLENVSLPSRVLLVGFYSKPTTRVMSFSTSPDFIPVAIYCHTQALDTLLYKETEM